MKHGTPLIKSKRSLIIALILFTVMIVFSIRYPGPDTLLDALLRSLGIPLYSRSASETGLHSSGIFLTVLFIVALFYLNKAISRHRLVLFFAAFICLNSAPDWLVIGYQHYFASSIYAVGLDPHQVNCNYVWIEQQLSGNCQLPIKNHSKDAITVQAVLELPIDSFYPVAQESILLSDLVLQPRADNSFHKEFKLALTSNEPFSGQINGAFKITLSDGQHARVWK
ncbi:hypothetical protein [Paenibacillus monticola]|uniref:Uncharacterized protein n=1 Tax=Paenibacillus monticola TaxID=2666075 RepID=A0A7X2H9R3_9BACL|nr:hypothetical protein [Paenibacillus monticola]MRN55458.1 hypothetical protein [Paenibacillus monticola]